MIRQAVVVAVVLGSGVVAMSAQAPPAPSFEVASVKRNVSGERVSIVRLPPSGTATIVNASLQAIIRTAFDVRDYQLVGAPEWIANERFDVTAKIPAETRLDQIPLMLRRLLAERFALRVRRETQEQRVYALSVARPDGRLGPQLTRSVVDCAATRESRRLGQAPPLTDGGIQCGERMGRGHVALGNRPLSRLLPILEETVGRPVDDRTGLSGLFDLTLQWRTDLTGEQPAPAVGAQNLPSIFAAIEEQLGLKLAAITAPLEVLVIESVARPTPD